MKTATRRLALLLVLASAPSYTASAQPSRAQIRAFREANEAAILRELVALVALPNLAANVADIHRNAEMLVAMLERRGVTARKLELPGAPPAVYGELLVPGATRTLGFHAHFDGQPVDSSRWASPAWTPLLRDGPLELGGQPIPLQSPSGRYDPEARLYGRSASDDKSPIVAMLWALDALRASGSAPSVNLKFFLEGEEEAGSPHLREMLSRRRSLLTADLWIMGDGPVHASRARQIVFGPRGMIGVNLTVYGPSRPLHSGHYGNWAPNPNVALIHLLASMRAEDGRITIDGYYGDVAPITAAEREAIAAVPLVEAQLAGELRLARTEGGANATLSQQIALPALNVSGLSGGLTGPGSANLIVSRATAFLDLRMVPNQTPAKVQLLVEQHLTRQGFHLVTQAMGARLVRVPTMGGSAPLYHFRDVLGSPIVILPIVNHDNNQHGENENLRLANLWEGIELYAGVLARIGATWNLQP